MSINSMTGLGRKEYTSNEYSIIIEAKSVNHRFREIKFKVPFFLSFLEPKLRKILDKNFKRGYFDISINFKRGQVEKKVVELDHQKIKNYITQIESAIGDLSRNLRINPVDFLRSEFMIDSPPDQLKEVQKCIISTYEAALDHLFECRREEGKKLGKVIQKHLDQFEEHLEIIASNADLYYEDIKERLNNRLKEINLEIHLDQSRFDQEIIYYLEKVDISEEIDRIKGHCEKLKGLLKQEGGIGREVDFTLQELNREVNTIGSKSNKKKISNTVIQMKVQLEKIREQALNIE